jgi:hypothetical protein
MISRHWYRFFAISGPELWNIIKHPEGYSLQCYSSPWGG